MSNSFLSRANVVSVAQSCPTLGDPMDCSLPGSSVHGILQAKILEWTAMPSSGDLPDPGMEPRSPVLTAASPSSRGSSPPRDGTPVSLGAGRFSLLQGIFLTQGLNSGLPQCWQIRPPPGDLPDTGWTQVSHVASRFFTSWAPREQRRHLPRGQQLRLVTGYNADEVLSTVGKSCLVALF